MGKKFISENTLTDIADAIRTKRGTSDPIDPANFATEIASIPTGSGGGSGGGSSGGSSIAEGFTVNFYNHSKELIETHSAKCGFLIDKPISYQAGTWRNENNHVNNFPLTVASEYAGGVYNLYASDSEDCVRTLLDHYGLDSGYTHVMVANLSSENMCVYFGTPPGGIILQTSSDKYGFFNSTTQCYYAACEGQLTGNVIEDLRKIMMHTSRADLSASSGCIIPTGQQYYYTSWPDGITYARLDETLYTT